MKILVIGGTGIYGSKIVSNLSQNNEVHYTFMKNKLTVGTGHRLDIINQDETVNLINQIFPDIIIHAAGLAYVDLCETNKKLAHLMNVVGTQNVVIGCKKTNSKIIYISTSFVFDGKKEEYFEDDKPSPSTNYGLTKLNGESIISESGQPFLILRTDQPYCWKEPWQRNNSVLRVIDTIRKREMLNEIIDWKNVPTYVPDFANALNHLITKKLTGIFHVCGSDFISRYEWALKTAEVFELDKELINQIRSDKLNLPVKRVNVNLNNEKLYNKTGFKMMSISKGLEEMKYHKKLFN